MQIYKKAVGLPLITMAILSLSLQGCNGSDDSDDEVPPAKITASLATPAISNLAYEGSLGSEGRTDNKGSYDCISDETVTFKLGAAVLGTVTCSEDMPTTLMQLAGGEITVETALDEMQRAGGTREVMAYDKWNNRLTLLAYLDENADLSDGVQLPDGTDNIEFFESGKVNFDLDESLFFNTVRRVSEQIARAGLLERYVYPRIYSTFVNELEKEAGDGLLFPGYMLSSSFETSGDETTLETTEKTYIYDEDKGLLTNYVSFSSGSFSSEHSWEKKHDAEGRLVEKVYVYPGGGTRTDTLEWDEQDKILKSTAQAYDANGVKTEEVEVEYFYNTDGSLDRSSQIFNSISQTAVTVLTEITTLKEYTYKNGLLSQRVTDYSVAINGEIVDSEKTVEDMDILYIDDMSTYHVSTTATDGVGNISRTTTETLTRDDLGRWVSREYAEVIDSNTFSNIIEREFNDDGYPVLLSRTYYQNGEEIGRYEDAYIYAGTPLGRLSSKVRKIYNPEYKNGEEMVRVFGLSYTYNDNGLHTSVTERTTSYQDGNGNELESPVVTDKKHVWIFDNNNNPTSIEIDDNGDGIVDTNESYSWVRLPRFGGVDEYLSKGDFFPNYDESFNVYSDSDDAASITSLLEFRAKSASGDVSRQIDDILPATPTTLFDKSKLGF